ncbi:MAG: methionine--tRNA ligase subunit beta [Candidatus Omnitrophica bacterium]|nr:methionine--tRNA ligase subunit beta [Candidatus Omnitrophota bacterium]
MITLDDFKKVELKVAKVLEAKLHPQADRLLLLRVDAGGQEKEIVAGIARHYTPESLTGKLVVLVNNLEPAVIRGVVSSGMVLAASDGQGLSLLTLDKPVAAGGEIR